MKKSTFVFAFIFHSLVLGFSQKLVEQKVIIDAQKNVSAATQKKLQPPNVVTVHSKSVNYFVPESAPYTDPAVNSYKHLFEDATQAFQAKKFAECLDLCDYMLALNRNSAEAYFLKGASLYGLGKQTLGIHLLKIAAAKGSKDAQEVLRGFDK